MSPLFEAIRDLGGEITVSRARGFPPRRDPRRLAARRARRRSAATCRRNSSRRSCSSHPSYRAASSSTSKGRSRRRPILPSRDASSPLSEVCRAAATGPRAFASRGDDSAACFPIAGALVVRADTCRSTASRGIRSSRTRRFAAGRRSRAERSSWATSAGRRGDAHGHGTRQWRRARFFPLDADVDAAPDAALPARGARRLRGRHLASLGGRAPAREGIRPAHGRARPPDARGRGRARGTKEGHGPVLVRGRPGGRRRAPRSSPRTEITASPCRRRFSRSRCPPARRSTIRRRREVLAGVLGGAGLPSSRPEPRHPTQIQWT